MPTTSAPSSRVASASARTSRAASAAPFSCPKKGGDLVFAGDDPATLGRISRDVHEALRRWEPRIDIVAVDAATDPDEPARVLVRIEYSERATNSRHNLVYPFYLQ